MHQASLRKSVPSLRSKARLKPARPQSQRGNIHFLTCGKAFRRKRDQPLTEVFSLVSQALFCWSGTSGQVNNKALALRNSNGHMNFEEHVYSARRWHGGCRRSQLQKSVLPKKAKCKNHQATDLVKFTCHSPQAGEPLWVMPPAR